MTREKQTFLFRQFFNFHQPRTTVTLSLDSSTNMRFFKWMFCAFQVFRGRLGEMEKFQTKAFCACNTPVSRYRAIGEKCGWKISSLWVFLFANVQLLGERDGASGRSHREFRNQHRGDCEMPNLDLENDEHARDGERRKPEMAKTSFQLRTCFNMLAETCPSIWLFASFSVLLWLRLYRRATTWHLSRAGGCEGKKERR